MGGTITGACDCKGALDRSLSNQAPTPSTPNYDLLWEIYKLRQYTPITWHGRWVRGHQDDTVAQEDLDSWAKLNIEMDTLAKEHWERLNLQRPAPFSLPPSLGTWSVWQHGQRIPQWTRQIADQLYFNPAARQYWALKYRDFPHLNYDAIRLAYKGSSLYYQMRVPKILGRWLPVGHRMGRWSPQMTTACPRCGDEDETHIHILACQHPGAIAKATRWLHDLELWLVRESTHPDLRFGVLSLLRSGFRSSNWTPPCTSDEFIQALFQRQRQQGNQNVMFGWWASGWADAQQMYYRLLNRRTTGQRWLSRLIRKQWEISWDLWRHRIGVAASPDSFSLAVAHERINAEIHNVYLQLSNSEYAPLQRWFRRPVNELTQQHLAFKQDWLCMVHSFATLIP